MAANPEALQKQLAELMAVVTEEHALRRAAEEARQQAEARLAEANCEPNALHAPPAKRTQDLGSG